MKTSLASCFVFVLVLVASECRATTAPGLSEKDAFNSRSVPAIALPSQIGNLAEPTSPGTFPPSFARKTVHLGDLQSALARISLTAWCGGTLLFILTYIMLLRAYTVDALIKKVHAEELLASSSILADSSLHHPALVAIRKWNQFPSCSVERAYRWLDQNITSVFGTLITRGEGLRTLTLNVSFASTLLAFVMAMTAGHDIERILAEVSGALGATLFGIMLFTIETMTLARLGTEATRLEFEGREMLDVWGATKKAPPQESQVQPY